MSVLQLYLCFRYGVVRKIMNVTKHFIQGKRIRVELSRPRIEFSHQTKTVFVGRQEDGIGDTIQEHTWLHSSVSADSEDE